MALRMSGMMSGMDTDSIVQDLVAVRQKKIDVQKKAQTKLQWKQDAWKELSSKIRKFQSKYVSNMRFATSFSKKVTKVSNSSAVSVLTGDNAVNGVQTMKVKKLAKTAYLTGGELTGANGNRLTALSKLSDIDGMSSLGDGSFTVKAGNKTVDIQTGANTTINDVLNQLKDAGLNASFDEKNQRLFVSAKESGAANDFSLVAGDAEGAKALQALGLQTDLTATDPVTGDYTDPSMREYVQFSNYYVPGNDDASKQATLDNMRFLINADRDAKVDSYFNQYKNLNSQKDAAQAELDRLATKYASGGPLGSAESYRTALDAKNEEIRNQQETINGLTGEAKTRAEEALRTLQDDANALSEKLADATIKETQEQNITNYDTELTRVGGYITVTGTGDSATPTATSRLQQDVEDFYYNKAQYASSVVANPSSVASSATKVAGSDAEIELNGATFRNATNTFEINGLTITALAETGNETVNLTTEQDTDGIYDMVKGFLKEYNSLINEMDKLFNTAPAKGYEPLTADEKNALSDREVEEYEKKIKDALLSRDKNLSDVSTAMKSIMSAGVTVGGRKMTLSDFGIDTLGYFNAPDNEKNAYHIAGDPDDADSSGKTDKLKSMIASDPDTVISFFTQLSRDLYAKMDNMSKSVKGQRSYGSFYDDKKMQSDYDSYTSKIKTMEEKLNAYEDSWYKKFSKMETAMAKMQTNANAIAGLFGGK